MRRIIVWKCRIIRDKHHSSHFWSSETKPDLFRIMFACLKKKNCKDNIWQIKWLKKLNLRSYQSLTRLDWTFRSFLFGTENNYSYFVNFAIKSQTGAGSGRWAQLLSKTGKDWQLKKKNLSKIYNGKIFQKSVIQYFKCLSCLQTKCISNESI